MVRCCVEVHCGTVLGNKYWSSFLRNVVAIANNRNDNGAISTEMEITHQKNRKNSELHITRIELTTLLLPLRLNGELGQNVIISNDTPAKANRTL